MFSPTLQGWLVRRAYLRYINKYKISMEYIFRAGKLTASESWQAEQAGGQRRHWPKGPGNGGDLKKIMLRNKIMTAGRRAGGPVRRRNVRQKND